AAMSLTTSRRSNVLSVTLASRQIDLFVARIADRDPGRHDVERHAARHTRPRDARPGWSDRRPSGQLASALALGRAWLGELEAAGLDRAVGYVVGDDHAGREGFRLDELEPGRRGAGPEQAFALAEHDREDQHGERVDEGVLPQGLQEIARALHQEVGAV